jgi:hypothetical protein
MRRLLIPTIALGLLSLSSASSGGEGVWRPAPGTSWQIQLQGRVDTSFDVAVYDVDLFDTRRSVIDGLHADGRRVVCYFSAGSYEEWRPDAADFPEAILGDPLDDWPGERWLDVRDTDALRRIMRKRLNLAAAKGCDAVDPDNVDGYSNDTGFALSGRNQSKYNRWLARQAHRRGLGVGLKNDLGQVGRLVDHFDFAVNEQCFEYDECNRLRRFVDQGKAVFGIEYSGSPASFCPQASADQFSTLKKRLSLRAWRRACGAD